MKKTASIILLLIAMGILSLACSGPIQDEGEYSPIVRAPDDVIEGVPSLDPYTSSHNISPTSFHNIPYTTGPYMRIYPVFSSVGSTSTMPVYLSGVTNGVSGFMLQLEVAEPKMAAIAGIRDTVNGLWSIKKADDGSGAMVNVAMADIHQLLGKDTRLVFEVDILHLQPGVTHIVLNGVLRVDDEEGNEAVVSFVAGEVSSR